MDDILSVQSLMLLQQNKLVQKKCKVMVQRGDKPPKGIVLPESKEQQDDPSTDTAEFTKGSRSTSIGAAGAPATQTSELWVLGSQAHEESEQKKDSLSSYPTGQEQNWPGRHSNSGRAILFEARAHWGNNGDQAVEVIWLGTFTYSLLPTCLIGKIMCQHIEMTPKEWKTCSSRFCHP